VTREQRKEKRCACGCGRRFVPTRPHHRYFAPSCRARSYLARQIERRARSLVAEMQKESR